MRIEHALPLPARAEVALDYDVAVHLPDCPDDIVHRAKLVLMQCAIELPAVCRLACVRQAADEGQHG